LGDIPILGRLFGVQTDGKTKKEVLMSITPHIVRNNRQVDSDLLEMWSGTENNIRYGNRQSAAAGPATPQLPAANAARGAKPMASPIVAPVVAPAAVDPAQSNGQSAPTSDPPAIEAEPKSAP
jgi:general secretion pathway protein D